MEKLTSFEEHLDRRYGARGSSKREEYEAQSLAFRIGEMLKDERRRAQLTQEELAEKTGTKKSYISRIEKGKAIFSFPLFTNS